jgi:hypothetical protein
MLAAVPAPATAARSDTTGLTAAPPAHLATQWQLLARSRGARAAAAAEASDSATATAPANPWRWQAADGTADALPNDWLLRLNATVAGRWLAEPALPSGPQVQLWLYGQRIGHTVFGAGQVWLCDVRGRCERAEGDVQALEALRPVSR